MSRACFKTCTEGKTKIHTILWTVHEILEREGVEVVDIYPLCTKTSDELSDITDKLFQLQMQFLAESEEEYVIQISFRSSKPLFFLKYDFTVGLDQQEPHSFVSKKYRSLQENLWEHICTIDEHDRDELTSSDGSLRLKFEFRVIDDFKEDKIEIPGEAEEHYVPVSQYHNELNNFENFLNNGLFSDIFIKSADEIEFKAHKVVLASRSAVIKAHFEHSTAECFTNFIESPFESDVLKQLLIFIYSNKAPRLSDMPERLLAAADYYEIKQLKLLCEKVLLKNLTVENAIETLKLADLHSANTLKQSILDFIKKGNVKSVVDTEGWAELVSVEILKKISEYCIIDVDADTKGDAQPTPEGN